ncbi:spondin domain-containing protein [Jannaschia sp. LMIT008]|uniref:spondin domain-containing protein n=1 Tax=Jannaschia maritima TaxID=3032585 RepID=UPI0028118876|nr:spondin domain-containing protein [Jannaschia sp. LMIT008]
MRLTITAALIAATTLAAGATDARTVRVEFTNDQTAAGFFFTPLFSAFHDGTFDNFTVGEAAGAGVELIAEDGVNGANAGLNVTRGQAENVRDAGGQAITTAAPGGFGGAPVIDPGESVAFEIELDAGNDWFSFLTMVIPSNDVFIGNDDSMAYRLYDATGTFVFGDPIQVFASNAYDAGTERNGTPDATNDAAFTPGFQPLAGDGENGVVTALRNLSFLDGFPRVGGLGPVTGPTDGDVLLATISISEVPPIPLPAGAPLLLAGLGTLAVMRRRRG